VLLSSSIIAACITKRGTDLWAQNDCEPDVGAIGKGLLALMAILAQALLALVSGHLVTLFLFSVWHNLLIFIFKN
jgi:hypothetical protein